MVLIPNRQAWPSVGETLFFRYPDGTGFKHQFYSNFPKGRRVPPHVAVVPLDEGILVEMVRNAHIRRIEYVSVGFTSSNGTVLWTNVSRRDSRGVHYWMN